MENLSSNLFEIYIGLAFGILLLVNDLIKFKSIPPLYKLNNVILLAITAAFGGNFTYIALTVDDTKLGFLANYRIVIVLGSIAFIYSSLSSIKNEFCNYRKKKINTISLLNFKNKNY